jgi:hypothetical protein
MNVIINNIKLLNGKKSYQKPIILQELLLETKAGTGIPVTPRPLQDPSPFIAPGDFSINNEP